MLSNKEKILSFIEKQGQISVSDLDRVLDIERSMIHRHLKALLEEGKIIKMGKPPKVIYTLRETVSEDEKQERGDSISDTENRAIIEDNFLFITPKGERQEGIEGFIRWCHNREYDVSKKADEYKKVYKKYESFRKDGLIDGMEKFRQTFGEDISVYGVWYVDVYAWEVFGKTKLGQMLLYAKQSQNKELIREITKNIAPYIQHIIAKYTIEAIGYIPPTIKRSVQFMEELRKNFNASLPELKIEKIFGDIAVPQKSLSTLKDRMENAKSSVFIREERIFKRVLLIDDAVGSGATFQEVAKKLKKRGIATQVYCLAITGSAKGFDVISEV